MSIELKRACISRSAITVTLINFAMLIFGGSEIIYDKLIYDFDWGGSYIDKFLIGYGMGVTCILAVFFPITSVLAYSTSYRKERDSGYENLLKLKVGNKEYRSLKAFTTALVTFASLFIPCLLWLIICFFVFGGQVSTMTIMPPPSFLERLYSGSPFLYGLFYCFNAGIQGAVFAVFGLGLISVIRNKYLGMLAPFCFCLFSAAVIDRFARGLNALNLFVPEVYVNTAIGKSGIWLYDIVLILIGLICFWVGDKYHGEN